jgi:hypothetical protein
MYCIYAQTITNGKNIFTCTYTFIRPLIVNQSGNNIPVQQVRYRYHRVTAGQRFTQYNIKNIIFKCVLKQETHR